MTVGIVERLIPRNKKAAIREIYEDVDGWWVILNDGWNADGMDFDCRTIDSGGEEMTDVETLADIIIAAVNEGISKVEKVSETEMAKVTGGMGMGMPGMPF
jgi:hypothetical protein